MNRSVTHSARTIGHGDSAGIDSTSSRYPSRTVDAGVSCPSSSTSVPASSRRASSSRSSRSQFGYGLVTFGMTGKLYSGGGEVVAHSSVPPKNGSGPESGPRNRLQRRFPKISSNPAVRMNAPIVSDRL